MSKYHTALRCKKCKTIIMSLRRHDFVACECWNPKEGKGIAIDGGFSYIKFSGNLSDAEEILVKVL